MIGRSSGHFEKNLLHLQVRVAPPLCRKARFATKGEEGGGVYRKHGGETVSRYNQAQFLFAFAFKWFRVRYTRNVMQKVRVRVKSNRCTTQRTCTFIRHNGRFVPRIFLSYFSSPSLPSFFSSFLSSSFPVLFVPLYFFSSSRSIFI